MQKLLEDLFSSAEDAGIRLERVGGITTWEALPLYRYQAAIDRIRATIRPASLEEGGCGCVHIPDVSLVFPDGSEKRPDIAIYCREPSEEEQDYAITFMPEAVIEIISKGYEAKDYEIGAPFYTSERVKNVVTVDPRTKEVRHYTPARSASANTDLTG